MAEIEHPGPHEVLRAIRMGAYDRDFDHIAAAIERRKIVLNPLIVEEHLSPLAKVESFAAAIAAAADLSVEKRVAAAHEMNSELKHFMLSSDPAVAERAKQVLADLYDKLLGVRGWARSGG